MKLRRPGPHSSPDTQLRNGTRHLGHYGRFLSWGVASQWLRPFLPLLSHVMVTAGETSDHVVNSASFDNLSVSSVKDLFNELLPFWKDFYFSIRKHASHCP